MDEKKVINYWITAAKQDFGAAKMLFKSKKYHHSLFFCHLSIEKTLKAIVINNTKSAPPFTHDLIRLTERAGIHLTAQQRNTLVEISTFNIEARYDDYKLSFYKKATKSFSAKYIKKTEIILTWLKTCI